MSWADSASYDPMPLTGLTWWCHVCGEERPDSYIGTARAWSNVGGVTITTSARFCVDSTTCRIMATLIAAEWLQTSIGRRR